MTGNETELLYLFWSVLILAAVPVIYRLCRGRSQALTALDGFVFVSMGGIILLDFLPQALEDGGKVFMALLRNHPQITSQ